MTWHNMLWLHEFTWFGSKILVQVFWDFLGFWGETVTGPAAAGLYWVVPRDFFFAKMFAVFTCAIGRARVIPNAAGIGGEGISHQARFGTWEVTALRALPLAAADPVIVFPLLFREKFLFSFAAGAGPHCGNRASRRGRAPGCLSPGAGARR